MNLPNIFSELKKSPDEIKAESELKSMFADFLLETMLENAGENKKIDFLVMRAHKNLQDTIDKHMHILVLNENCHTEEHIAKKEEFLELLKKLTYEAELFDSTVLIKNEAVENT